MPDEISQAQAAQASAQPGATETTPPQGSTQQEAQTETQPNSEETMRRIAREEANRIGQSLVAKGEARIQKRIQEQFRAPDLNKKVLGLTDDQVKQARQGIVAEAYAAEEPEQPQASGAQSDEPNLDDYPPAVQAALAMMEDAGVTVQEGDPEFTELIKPILDKGNPGPSLLMATAKAIEKKQARTLQHTQAAPLRTPVPGSGAGTGTFTAKSANDYWNRAHKK